MAFGFVFAGRAGPRTVRPGLAARGRRERGAADVGGQRRWCAPTPAGRAGSPAHDGGASGRRRPRPRGHGVPVVVPRAGAPRVPARRTAGRERARAARRGSRRVVPQPAPSRHRRGVDGSAVSAAGGGLSGGRAPPAVPPYYATATGRPSSPAARTAAEAHWARRAAAATDDLRLYGRPATPRDAASTRMTLEWDERRRAAIHRAIGEPGFASLSPDLSRFALLATLLVVWLHRVSGTVAPGARRTGGRPHHPGRATRVGAVHGGLPVRRDRRAGRHVSGGRGVGV